MSAALRGVLYARVSTVDQDPSMQLAELRAYCARRSLEIVGEFVDHGVSGSKESRPELNRLMTAAKRREFDAVVVYRYDRFARSLRHLVNALEEFRALGIDFISLHEGVDTSTPNGRLIFGIFASIAEFERELIRERIKSALRLAKARGHRPGPRPIAVDAARIAKLRAAGRSWREISAEMGISTGVARRAVLRGDPSLSAKNFTALRSYQRMCCIRAHG